MSRRAWSIDPRDHETALRGIFVIDYVNESINEAIVATNFS